jgi:O-antigen ligase
MPTELTTRDTHPTRRLLGFTAPQSLIFAALTVALALLLYGAIPETAAVLIVVVTGIPVWWMQYLDRRLPWPAHSTWALGVWALGAWIAASATWAPSPNLALQMAATFSLYALCVEAWGNFATGHAKTARRRVATSVLVIFPMLSLYIAFEALSGQAIRNTLTNLIPALLPRPHHMSVDAQGYIRLNAYMLNRNMAALMCLLWPTALFAFVLFGTRHLKAAALGVGALAVLAVAMGNHGSSKLALLSSGAAFVVALWHTGVARRLVQVVWTALCLAIVPAAFVVEQAEVYRAEQLPYSTAHRFLIWGETARAIVQQPLVGAGSGATRILDAAGPKGEVKTGRFVFPAGLNLHAHNIYLQTWFELGAIGAVLLWLVGLHVLAWIGVQRDRVSPFALAAFTTGAALGSTSYAYNDPWFMASLGLTMIWIQVGAAVDRDLKSDNAREPVVA